MAAPLDLQFVRSAAELAQLPPTDAEVAVVGRSNVGKSSLVNALAHRRNLAHVSKTPGRTQLLNVFTVDGRATLVDLPGYGFAAAPGRVKAGWQAMIEGYLLGREALEVTLVLVDGEIGPTPLDLQMLEWLDAHGLARRVVATKHDKVKSSRREKRKRELAQACGLAPGDVLWASATTGVGIDRLRDLVRGWLGLAAAGA
jgi:GTP-binding protein